MLALIFAGWKYAGRSWRYLEVSVMSPANIPIYQFKSIIIAAGILLTIQGITQVFRCILTIQRGAWPERESDVEELETVLQKEGIAALHPGSESADVVTPKVERS